jgi:hypothetical protein
MCRRTEICSRSPRASNPRCSPTGFQTFARLVPNFWRLPRSSTACRTAASVCWRQDRCGLVSTAHSNSLVTTPPTPCLIRVWMRTAVRKEVTSFGTFVSTLCHEFCHHLDFQKFGFRDSWHTRGFYERAAALYHHARGTPLKKLFWIPMTGGRWRIDWQRTNRGA